MLLSKIRDTSITHNVFRIQSDDSTMCGFYCIAFIEYMIAEKTFLDYTNLFSPNEYKKTDKVIYRYFKDKYSKPWFQTKKIDEIRNNLLE